MEEIPSKITNIPQVKCINNSLVVHVCINESCFSNAFICNDNNCLCYSYHKNCTTRQLSQILLNIQQYHNKVITKHKKSLQILLSSFDQMLQLLSYRRQQFIQFVQTFGFGIKARHFLKQMELSNKFQCNGVYFHDMLQQFEQCLKNQQFTCPQYAQDFKTQQILKLKQICNAFDSYQVQPFTKILNSSILSKKQELCRVQGQERIRNFLNRPVRSFQRLFKASQNQFSASSFHRDCDSINETIILAQTEYGKIIGGFTPLAWKSIHRFDPDYHEQSFLFSLNQNQKFQLSDIQHALFQSNRNGPAFGKGCDLLISDKCNEQRSCFSSISTTYKSSKIKQTKIKQSHNIKLQMISTAFTGQPHGYNFKIIQYEVFKVKWK